MQHRRSVRIRSLSGPAVGGGPKTGSRDPFGSLFDLDRSLSAMADTCTCGAPGGWYGHERHCGLVEPASECALPAWQHTSTDAEDLEF